MARAHRPTAATLPCGNLVLICELSVAGGVLHTALASLYCHSNVYHNLLAPLRSNASSFPPFTHSSSLLSPADGRVDRDLLHAALPAVDEKWCGCVSTRTRCTHWIARRFQRSVNRMLTSIGWSSLNHRLNRVPAVGEVLA